MEQKNKGSCITFWMRGRRSAQPAPWTSKTWCLTTKEQGIAGSEAPRQVRRRRLGLQRRGARRRRNKVLRGVRHHVRYAGGALSSEDVVLDDEGTRFCGERSTTPGTSAAPWGLKTWCLTTKEQGIAGSGAPRHRGGAPPGRRPGKSKPLARARCRVPRRQRLAPRRRPTKKGPTHSRSP